AKDEPVLYRSAPPEDAFEPVGFLSDRPAGLAFDPSADLVYAGGERLLALDPSSGEARSVEVTGVAGPLRAPALDPATRTLYLLAGETASLVAIDLHTGAGRTVGHFRNHAQGGYLVAADADPPILDDLAFA